MDAGIWMLLGFGLLFVAIPVAEWLQRELAYRGVLRHLRRTLGSPVIQAAECSGCQGDEGCPDCWR